MVDADLALMTTVRWWQSSTGTPDTAPEFLRGALSASFGQPPARPCLSRTSPLGSGAEPGSTAKVSSGVAVSSRLRHTATGCTAGMVRPSTSCSCVLYTTDRSPESDGSALAAGAGFACPRLLKRHSESGSGASPEQECARRTAAARAAHERASTGAPLLRQTVRRRRRGLRFGPRRARTLNASGGPHSAQRGPAAQEARNAPARFDASTTTQLALNSAAAAPVMRPVFCARTAFGSGRSKSDRPADRPKHLIQRKPGGQEPRIGCEFEGARHAAARCRDRLGSGERL
jgi:hypothetical protein